MAIGNDGSDPIARLWAHDHSGRQGAQVIGVMPQRFRFLDGEQPSFFAAAAGSQQDDVRGVQL